ncbi:MAG: MarR family transcriptional regulator [Rikenellaceae bacterium]|jgi:Mn-dependent DtxR family transcriptional regulator|nr:MarR family transcriptional regulator [Rikenellaceae bacterium]
MEEKILAALTEPAKAGDVATKIGADKAEVAKIIKKLQKEGKVTSPKMCFYQAVK